MSEINVLQNTACSSILPALSAYEKDYPQAYTRTEKETIQVKTLDSIFDDYYQESDQVLVKLDVQGYEKQVIEGSIASLPRIRAFQIELSLVRFYEDEPLIAEMLELMSNLGYALWSIERGASNQTTGQLLQIDGIFVRDTN